MTDVAAFLVAEQQDVPFGGKARAKGLRLIATDVDWETGEGVDLLASRQGR